MLKLNAVYAFQNIAGRSGGKFRFSEQDVPAPKEGEKWHPKNILIRNSIIKDVDGLRELMFEAASEMSVDEFMNWPALSFIRGTDEFRQTIREIDHAILARALDQK